MYHDPVLRDEVARFLLTPTGRVYVDGTVGGGGHADEICRRTAETTRVVCFDADEDAIRFARNRLRPFAKRVLFVHSNFRNLESELRARRIPTVDGLLLDLGVSSFQLDEPSKGFSFRSDERIDMRVDRRQPLSGWDVVNGLSEEELARIIWNYGEERNARRVARAIVSNRPIDTTGALVNVVSSIVGERFRTKTLARVFQAIRIQVNAELENLRQVLLDALQVLAPGGRVVVIAYHSLEDRIVKEFFKQNAASVIPSGSKYLEDRVVVPRLKLLTKRPVTATPAEIARNPRARSAKLRVAERVNA